MKILFHFIFTGRLNGTSKVGGLGPYFKLNDIQDALNKDCDEYRIQALRV